jgi:dienelactone hydrolase
MEMRMKNGFKALVAMAVALACAAHAQTKVEFKSQVCVNEKSFLDACRPITVPGTDYEASKEAIVLITHGSDGVDERHHRYARHLRSMGISALVIDHWKPRGVTGVQSDFVRFARQGANAQNLVIDIFHAAAHFRGLGYSKVGYLGESMGGGVAVLLTKAEYQQHFRRVSGAAPEPLDAVVGLYGNCNERYSYDRFLPVPTLLITGELDANTPAKTCRDYVAEWVDKRGGRFTFIELPGQHHDFDAEFPLQKSHSAQNPAKCISVVDLDKITSTLTGETYPNTPVGWERWRSKCLMKPNEVNVSYGHTGDKNAGFKAWGLFFNGTLF